jgi:hypothetical protein
MSEPASPDQPLVILDPQGTPARLSYNVPEPTSYSGRNYINLSGIDDDDWIGYQSPDNSASSTPVPLRFRISSVDQPAIVAPPGIEVLSHPSLLLSRDHDGVLPESPVVVSTVEPITDRLAALTRGEVLSAHANGLVAVPTRNSAGLLDVRFVPPFAEVAMTPTPASVSGGDGSVTLEINITSPSDGASVSGPAEGVTLTVTGTWRCSVRLRPSVVLTLDDATKGVEATVQGEPSGYRGTWHAPITLKTAGSHTILVDARAGAGIKETRADTELTLNVQLSNGTGSGDPTKLPQVTVAEPTNQRVFFAKTEVATISFRGSVNANQAGKNVTVELLDTTTGATKSVDMNKDSGNWNTTFDLPGIGEHTIQVTGKTDTNVSAPVNLTLTLSAQPPFRRLIQRLLIVETISMSSFLGGYGAGRVLRTFSLLPGEKTTISVKTYTQTDESRKTASSVLDSTSKEASADYDETIAQEASNKAAESEAFNYKVGAEASATWGWGSAKISAEFSGSANSAREEAVKNVKNATQKHASKASSNRNVTVNTDYQVQTQEKAEESTTREISNINVSRTLNFTFRQLNQEHIVLVHLTNIRVAFFAWDMLLNQSGQPATNSKGDIIFRPTWREVSLPELQDLLRETVVEGAWNRITQSIQNALSGIPDWQDKLQTVIEGATPKDKTGNPVDGAAYLRFPRNLTQTWEDPAGSGTKFSVPGIILSYDKVIMRTDGVIVDSILGGGEALDKYSKDLQDQTIEGRRVANEQAEAAVKRELLAQEIVRGGDKAKAAIFVQMFAPPPRPHHPNA